MKYLRFALGFGVALLMAMAMILMGPEGLARFFNVPSVLVVLLIPAGIMVARYGKRAFFFHRLAKPLKREVLEAWDKLCMSAAWLGVFVAVVQVGFNLSNVKVLGPALAISVLPVVYAYCLRIFLFLPFMPTLAKEEVELAQSSLLKTIQN